MKNFIQKLKMINYIIHINKIYRLTNTPKSLKTQISNN